MFPLGNELCDPVDLELLEDDGAGDGTGGGGGVSGDEKESIVAELLSEEEALILVLEVSQEAKEVDCESGGALEALGGGPVCFTTGGVAGTGGGDGSVKAIG